MADFLVPFLAIALAELGDKTQLSVLLLSTRTKKHLQLLLGVMTAFLMVDGFAILVGSWITTVVPLPVLKAVSGALFIIFGLLILRDRDVEDGKEEEKAVGNPVFSGFLLIFLAEWGDKTQLASALFATEYRPWLVLAGTMMALGLLSAAAIFLGRALLTRLDKRLISRLAGGLFLLMGISFLLL
ncbi:MAG: hypothetical protein A4E47_00427 [Methanosaeta sp. PtaU1.Bin028]|nr:MAG: hypothetical protein A4E47_00427 [Methanosaeta sp. PtaU1.Bin028]